MVGVMFGSPSSQLSAMQMAAVVASAARGATQGCATPPGCAPSELNAADLERTEEVVGMLNVKRAQDALSLLRFDGRSDLVKRFQKHSKSRNGVAHQDAMLVPDVQEFALVGGSKGAPLSEHGTSAELIVFDSSTPFRDGGDDQDMENSLNSDWPTIAGYSNGLVRAMTPLQDHDSDPSPSSFPLQAEWWERPEMQAKFHALGVTKVVPPSPDRVIESKFSGRKKYVPLTIYVPSEAQKAGLIELLYTEGAHLEYNIVIEKVPRLRNTSGDGR